MPPWNPDDTTPVTVLLTVTVAYTLYHYLGAPSLWTPRLEARWVGQGPLAALVVQRLVGFVLLGVVPAVIVGAVLPATEHGYGLRLGDLALGGAIVGGAAVVFGGMNAILARTASFQRNYPQLRLDRWTWGRLGLNLGGWALYLAAYEFFFRGFFLHAMVDAYGVWPAVFITTAVYVVVHLPKNAGETLGCIPMGVVFAWMSIATGSALTPFLVHLLIAGSAESFAVLFNPALRPGQSRE